jgi:hypothetical protein
MEEIINQGIPNLIDPVKITDDYLNEGDWRVDFCSLT